MSLKNRAVTILLSVVFTLSTVARASVDNVVVYKDNEANYLKYICGFGDGTIRPDAPLTRAQCAKMLTYVMDLDDATECEFSDVSNSLWAYDAICRLSSAGIINGYGNGVFAPNKPLSRAEFAVLVTRIAEFDDGESGFSDTKGHWAEKAIAKLAASEYISGYHDNTFRPDATITRAEAVKIINKVLDIKIDKEETRELFSDLPTTHWAYYEIMAAVSLFTLESVIDREGMDFNDIEYIEIDVEKTEKELDELLNEFILAPVERQAEIFNKISIMESDITHAIAMSGININRDVTSTKDINNMNASATIQNVILKAKEKRYKYLAVVKDPAIFEEKIGMKIADIPKPDSAKSEKLVALYVEEQNYENEFSSFMYSESILFNGEKYSLAQAEASSISALREKALDYYVENKRAYGEIFTNLISVRTRIANFFGYRYYTDLGYMRAGKFYYSPEDVSVIRKDVKKYIAPLYYKIGQAAKGHNNGYINLNYPVDYTRHNKTAISVASDFLSEMSPQSREAMAFLNEYNLIDEEMRPNKALVAFTSYIDKYELPFVFMNATGSIEDVETFSHEFGHAFHAFRIGSDGVSAPPDVAEIASYGMEMLTMHNYDEFYGEDAATKEQLVNIYYKLQIILLSTFMDEFQYMVYKDTLLTADERNALYAKLFKEYFPGMYFNHEAKNSGIAWVNPAHIFTEPYYSIDYTLALLVAFQLWDVGQTEGFDKEFELYMSMLESPYVNTNIHTVAVTSGVKSPFAKDSVKDFAIKMEELFKKE